MLITPEIWDVAKIVGGAYIAYVLAKTDLNQRELFKRLRDVETSHAELLGEHRCMSTTGGRRCYDPLARQPTEGV